MILNKMQPNKQNGGSTPPASLTTRIFLNEWIAGGSLFYTDDFGLTWSETTNPSTNGMPLSMDINPDGLGVVAMSRNASVDQCYTLDYGETLNIIPDSAGRYGGGGAYVSKDGSVMLVNRSNGTSDDLKMSFDGGSNWVTKGSGNYDAAVTRGNDDGSIIFYADYWRNPGIFKSTNQGTSWTKIKSLPRTYSFVTSDECQYMLCGCYPDYSKIYSSNDYGATWVTHTINPASLYIISVAINSTGQYQSAFGGINDFYYSDDYGVTFVKKTVNFSLQSNNRTYRNDTMSKDGKIILAAPYPTKDYYYTLDRGDNWIPLPMPSSSNSFITPFLLQF